MGISDAGDLYMSWSMMDQLIREYVLHLTRDGLYSSFTRIVAIARGGLPVATMLAYQLRIDEVHTLSLQQYRGQRTAVDALGRDPMFEPLIARCNNGATLVVDDVADKGTTMRFVHELLPLAARFVLVTKPAGQHFQQMRAFAVPQNCWVHFPWEVLADPYISSV